MAQTTDTLLLVRPSRFRKNEETAVNNYFQEDVSDPNRTLRAQQEFDSFVDQLHTHNINTLVIQDGGEYDTPDSIFPNNCISFHQQTVVLYPMFAENRRRERKLGYLQALKQRGLTYNRIINYTRFEKENRFLEGTGSLILDRVARIAYCSLSPRASADMVHQFCLDLDYEPFIFVANQTVDGLRLPIYHTNVMLSVGTHFAVLCTESIDNRAEKERLIRRLQETGKAVIAISEEQMHNFAGNILEVKSTTGKPHIIMSSRAFRAFNTDQLNQLHVWGSIIHSPLTIIEKAGGGSARCMLAEVFY
ncbi:citrulline utilization hydrolase CtlX [Sphingobacterium corticibacterium]|uniref:Amidinotransferase n=1 Tax=Sphingobacterium corticibacterium TaxID=2484746 RepID=A0A4Q6XV38_9SPHI|nr:arginine deiminase-related protein [Sphingobacterium corticibacterium]RZF60256.1 amidinotransferase [Sphingobacterium corticibacterium]